MITRVRIEANGASAAEVEQHLRALADAIDKDYGLQFHEGEQVITREMAEPWGTRHAFSGRLSLHPNVADDSAQVAWLQIKDISVTI